MCRFLNIPHPPPAAKNSGTARHGPHGVRENLFAGGGGRKNPRLEVGSARPAIKPGVMRCKVLGGAMHAAGAVAAGDARCSFRFIPDSCCNALGSGVAVSAGVLDVNLEL